MFTGLIEDIGVVQHLGGAKIIISTKLDDIKNGDSIAVNGVCLTVTEIAAGDLSFDYSPQTDKNTILSNLKKGDKVNLERALKLTSRLGGHIVSGHVDCVSKITAVTKLDNFYKISVEIDKNYGKYIADKGSVTVNGISLTVAEINGNIFDLYIIPETYKNTTLSLLKSGDSVNIETDILAKYTERLLLNKPSQESKISENFLKENGFF
ncbi:riboflavin synthase [Elusimicrobium posterum]|uniref:riboflavin synthase n=1 Tax=Elusimicrobium posterum TaxID=3116653 RepID=UPI003C79059F